MFVAYGGVRKKRFNLNSGNRGCARLGGEVVKDAAQDVAEDVPQDVPQDVAQDLAIRARAACALLATPPLSPRPSLRSSRLAEMGA